MRTMPQIATAFVAIALLPALAPADPPSFNVTWQYNPLPGHSAERDQAARVQDRAINAARDQLRRVTFTIIRQFETSQDLATARVEAATAQAAYEQAAQTARSAATADVENQSAVVEIENLESKLAAARATAKEQGKDNTEETDQLAIALFTRRCSLTSRINKSLSADRHLRELQYKVIDTNSRVRNLQADLSDTIHNDPTWRAAHAQLDQARSQLVTSAAE